MNRKIINNIVNISITSLLVMAHIIIALIFVNLNRYYNMYPEIFGMIFAIVVCILLLIDIVFIIGLKYKDIIQKIIVCVFSIVLIVGGLYGVRIFSQTNKIVSNVLQINGENQYETIGGIFVSYKNNTLENVNSLEELKKINNIKIGSLSESSENSISGIGYQELTNAGVTGYATQEYQNNTDLLFGLIHGDIDIAIFSNMYQAVFKADENVDYSQYLSEMHEIASFDREIIVQSNASKKDLSKDPFNVLLIGWSPIIGSTTIGLADAIIVASVNPQTYTVSMMSIARDSYVPISCYGGACDKINSGRSTSMDCFVNTVEDLIGKEIDFYMEIDFSGFADLCGHFGGIEIDNPVSFELDGVYVPAGKYVANGWQALQFARERHHMPNGDFDRQKHQKEVIMELANQFLNHSITDALSAFDVVSDRLKTNMTLSQLTGMFNMLKNTKNNTGLSLFDLIDMHALRITGYADWHYSDEYELPLWIYRLYQGSIDESLVHMHEVLGEYVTIKQNELFTFSVESPYVRAPFYSTEYNEVETHEKLPAYYINLTSMTYADALIWAANNGATLVPTFIPSDSDEYDEALDGMVISQSIAYGKKVANYPTCNVTVMGDGKVRPKLPDSYDDWDIDHAKDWCKEKGYDYDAIAVPTDDADLNGIVKDMEIDDDKIIIEYYVYAETVKVPNLIDKTEDEAKAELEKVGLQCEIKYEVNDKVGKVINQSQEADKEVSKGTTITITIGTKQQEEEKVSVPNVVGKSEAEAIEELNKKGLNHSISYEESDDVGKVISQSPSSGDVSIGSTISLVVGKAKEEEGGGTEGGGEEEGGGTEGGGEEEGGGTEGGGEEQSGEGTSE